MHQQAKPIFKNPHDLPLWDYSPHGPIEAKQRFEQLHGEEPRDDYVVYFVNRDDGEIFPIWIVFNSTRPKLNYVLSVVRQLNPNIRLASNAEMAKFDNERMKARGV